MPAHILLVDDSWAVRRSLRSVIEAQTTWQIDGEARNGLEAVEKFRELRPDVIILDLSMPVMNGLEAARRIREISPSVYILLFTIHDHAFLLEDARKMGVNALLSKTAAASLLGVVQSALT